ncbi:MAG: PHP domain-containing protein [Pirellulaceae bacterium]
MGRLLVFILMVLTGLTVNLKAEEKVWLKGNIHTHTFWSDGNDFPEMIASWYKQKGYDFLALSDHNILSKGEKWMPIAQLQSRGGSDVLDKYRKAFGDQWVVTRGSDEKLEVRLRTLEEFRKGLEKDGSFLMIQSEEISDRSEGVPVHMNATNIQEVIAPVGGATVREAMANNLRAVAEQARRTGKPIILHLNHPNFGYAVTAEDLAFVVQERYLEIYNGHPGVNVLGDSEHASVESIWDIANTIRLSQLDAPPLFGVGTDDSHHYHGRGTSRPGRSWIMVRGDKLDADAITTSISQGDFYSSSGVTLSEVSFDSKKKKLALTIEPKEGVTYSTRFIGTRKTADLNSKFKKSAAGKVVTRIYSEDVGATLATVEGLNPVYQLQGDELYVRAVVTSTQPHVDPTLPEQTEQAWTQPVGWSISTRNRR